MGNSVNWQALQALAAGAGFSNMPIGEHEVEITKAEYKETTNKKDMFVVIFKAVSGPDAGSTHPNNFVISPESPVALGFFFQHMAALGLDAAYFAAKPNNAQIARDLVGRHAIITVREQRSDPSRTEVGSVRRSSGDAPAVARSSGPDPLDIFAAPAADAAPDGATPPALPF